MVRAISEPAFADKFERRLTRRMRPRKMAITLSLTRQGWDRLAKTCAATGLSPGDVLEHAIGQRLLYPWNQLDAGKRRVGVNVRPIHLHLTPNGHATLCRLAQRHGTSRSAVAEYLITWKGEKS